MNAYFLSVSSKTREKEYAFLMQHIQCSWFAELMEFAVEKAVLHAVVFGATAEFISKSHTPTAVVWPQFRKRMSHRNS